MRIIANIRKKLAGILVATNRYPLTIVFLIAIAWVNILTINNDTENYLRYLFSFIVGAMLSVVGQQIYERFFVKESARYLLMGGAILLAVLYYLTIGSESGFSQANSVKTAVIMFALFMSFIWVPAIKQTLTFNESFLAAFKGFFTTLLFATVIAGGISLIIVAIDNLLFSLDYKTTLHALNLVGSLFAPIFFLSFIPMYLGEKDAHAPSEQLAARKEAIAVAVGCPKNLDVLISYIVIPLTAIYTVILLIYVLINIGGDFWTENLMEPLLVSYSVIVIIVYILASNLENKFTILFRNIFPKVLIPIVLFQTIASVLKISDMGITHGRYYVIMFGLFALITGVIFSFVPPKKNGMIVAVLLVFSIISIVPPTDAFSISKANQTNLLKDTLIKNSMWENEKVVPNSTVSVKDKQKITKTVQYLRDMNYTEEIEWLPDEPMYSDVFRQTFGFNETYEQDGNFDGEESKYAYYDLGDSNVFAISDYDFMTSIYLNHEVATGEEKPVTFDYDGKTYILQQKREGDQFIIQLRAESGIELIRYDALDIFTATFGEDATKSLEKDMLSAEEATFTVENAEAKLTTMIQSIHMYGKELSGQVYVFVQIK